MSRHFMLEKLDMRKFLGLISVVVVIVIAVVVLSSIGLLWLLVVSVHFNIKW